MYLKILFFISLGIQLFYWLIIFFPFSIKKNKQKGNVSSLQKGVSVIICAKNEAELLYRYLPFFLNQKYTLFEVIVIDDDSTDETKRIISDFQKEYSHLKYYFLKPHEKILPGKRSALAKGVEQATYDWILVSDADCRPSSNAWIRYMTEPLSRNKQLVLGYAPYKYEFGWLNLLIRYETFYTALQYLSFAQIGHPYMGVGRNMAYTKPLFQKAVAQYHSKLPLSGDDDLMVQLVANGENTDAVCHSKAHVVSIPKRTFKEWFYQKTRHYTSGHDYTPKYKWILGGLYGASFLNSFLILYFILDKNFVDVIVYALALKFFILNCITYFF